MMAGANILPISREHLEGVAELERLCFAEPWSAKALELLLGDGAYAYVCVVDGEVVAYGGMLLALDEGQVTNVAVHPAHRRRGYGERVFSAMLEEARQRELIQISLEVRASNEAAITLYEKTGFTVAGRRRNFYKHPTEDALVMLKAL